MAERFDEILFSIAEQANSAVDYDAMREAVLKKNAQRARKARLRLRNLSMAAGLVLMLGAAALLFETGLGGTKSGAGADMTQFDVQEKSADMAVQAMPEEELRMFSSDDAQSPEAAPELSMQAAPADTDASAAGIMSSATCGLAPYDVTGWQSAYIGEMDQTAQQNLYGAFESVIFLTPQEVVDGQLAVGYAAFSPDGGMVLWHINAEEYVVLEDIKLTAENWSDLLTKSAK